MLAATELSRPDAPFQFEPGAHANDLNRRPFVLRHQLADHPLFRLERLAVLAEFLRTSGRAGSVLYREAAVRPHTMGAWDNLGDLASVGDVIRTCRESGAWVALHDSEADPEYRELLHGIVHELSSAVGRDLLSQAEYVTGHIFIGSPNSVTDYHMDSETNFLIVMAGQKQFHMYDGDDPAILPQQAIENFYWGTPNALRYGAALAGQDTVIDVRAGDCLHVPVNFPHWVQNGPEPCIALSVLLYLPENVDRAHAFQMNRLLRMLGIGPSPVMRSDLDAMRRKGRFFRLLSRRTPLDKRDVIASGRQRFKAPVRAARRIIAMARQALSGRADTAARGLF